MKLAAWMAGLCAMAVAACSPAVSPDDTQPDLVTIHGEIERHDRAGVDPATEPLFNLYGMTFQAALGLDYATLLALPQYEVETDYPSGGLIRRFSGPLLRDVLALAGPAGDAVVVTALDGYQRTLTLDQLDRHDVILALELEGRPLPVGGFGPAMLVWPRQTDPALLGMPDDDWVWGVFSLEVTVQADAP
jgi:hypothetical protein